MGTFDASPGSASTDKICSSVADCQAQLGGAVGLRLVRKVLEVVQREAEPQGTGDTEASGVGDQADELLQLAAADAGAERGDVGAAGDGLRPARRMYSGSSRSPLISSATSLMSIWPVQARQGRPGVAVCARLVAPRMPPVSKVSMAMPPSMTGIRSA